jgi:hypothetical protein
MTSDHAILKSGCLSRAETWSIIDFFNLPEQEIYNMIFDLDWGYKINKLYDKGWGDV